MPVSAGRSLAFRALGDARRSGRWIRDALRAEAGRSNATDQDRALAWRLAMGATAAKGLLEGRIHGLAKRSSAIQPQVLDALELAGFELLYLETPIPVAVSEGVELVRSVAPKAAGFANAILRRLAPLRDEVRAARIRMAKDVDTERDLLLVSALPHWLLNALNRSLTHPQLKALCLCALIPAPQWTIEVGSNDAPPDKGDPASCHRGVESDVISSAEQDLSTCDGRRDECGSGSRTDVHTSIHMDLTAQTVAGLTVPPDGASRLEIGMGRGTKTLVVAHALAERGEQAELVGVEPDTGRLRWARDEFAALDYDVATYRADGRALDGVPELRDRTFDLVFLDAPCTGTGTLRRHPEIAWSLAPDSLSGDDPTSLVNLQAELLAAAAGHVSEGGYLAYSTCSVLKEENAAQVTAFLASEEGRGFARVDIRETPGFRHLPDDARSLAAGSLTPEGAFATYPSEGQPDGHYLAFLRKESDSAN